MQQKKQFSKNDFKFTITGYADSSLSLKEASRKFWQDFYDGNVEFRTDHNKAGYKNPIVSPITPLTELAIKNPEAGIKVVNELAECLAHKMTKHQKMEIISFLTKDEEDDN
jgi:hypothetical protein